MTMVEPGGRVDRSTVTEARRRELETALGLAVRGEVNFDTGTRAVYATDSSNYRQVPRQRRCNAGRRYRRTTASTPAA